jgi:ribonuclease T
MSKAGQNPAISRRFRGFLPVVVDVETGGFNAETDALLEIAAVIIRMNEHGRLQLGSTHACHVEPFEGANLDEAALAFTGIDPDHPFRLAKKEPAALDHIFKPVRKELKEVNCSRAILVGHNAFFDLGFLNACIKRTDARSPFHSFSSFDTATLGGLAYGQTVLARIMDCAGLEWDEKQAHSAIYDAERTAELFCRIVNDWDARHSGGLLGNKD